MDLIRIRNEFNSAKEQFPNSEFHQKASGIPYVRVSLQANDRIYISSIYFPSSYPNEMPNVYVDIPKILSQSPHMYTKGNICYLHPSMWNPGRHNLLFAIARTAKWLNKYEVWKLTSKWPGASINH